MIELKTKEHLVYLLQSGLMRVSRYDLHFIQNLQTLTLRKEKITSNQVLLFDKIVEKYKRQLQKHRVTQEVLDSLYWETEIILSDPKHTEAYISIEGNLIVFRAPFNKKFMDEKAKQKSTFVWLKEKRRYESVYSTVALKEIFSLATRHYPKVNYCDEIKNMLNTLAVFDSVKFWSPTLIKHNSKPLLVAMNPYVADATKDIVIDNSHKCLVELSRYGIRIDSSITNNDPSLEFASNYIVEFDVAELDSLVEYISLINTDAVFFSGNAGLLPNHKKILQTKLADNGIYIDENHRDVVNSRLEKYKRPLLITKTYMCSNSYDKFIKVITLKNSLPVQLT